MIKGWRHMELANNCIIPGKEIFIARDQIGTAEKTTIYAADAATAKGIAWHVVLKSGREIYLADALDEFASWLNETRPAGP